MLIEESDETLREIAREARKFFWRVVLLIAFFIGLIVVSVASAGSADCAIFADIGVTSKALALEGISKAETKRIVVRMYQPKTPRAESLLFKIVDRAYADQGELNKFVQELYAACLRSEGNPEFLGVSI